jgi:hypothetical protein
MGPHRTYVGMMISLDDTEMTALMTAAARVPVERRSEMLAHLAVVLSVAWPQDVVCTIMRVAAAHRAKALASIGGAGDHVNGSEVATVDR